MVIAHCRGPIWFKDDFSHCFQSSFLQFLFPLIACGLSFILLVTKLVRQLWRSRSKAGYKALSLDNPDQPNGAHVIGEDDESLEGLTLQKTASRTDASVKEVDRPRGEVTWVAVEVAALLGEIGINIAALITHAWNRHAVLPSVAGIVTWCYIFVLVSVRLLRSATRRHYIPRVWNHTATLYGIQWLLEVLIFRSALVHPRSSLARALIVAQFALTSLLFLIALTTRKGNKAVVLEYEGDLEPSREPLASVLSLATFEWVDAIVWRGYKKTLELPDVWNLTLKEKAAAVLDDFRQTKKTANLAWRLLKYFKGPILVQGLWAMFSNLFTFAPTLLLKAILEYVEDPASTPANAAWFYVILLFCAGVVQAVGEGQALWIGRKICIKLRAIIIGEIYGKALRRKAAASTETDMNENKQAKDTDADKDKQPSKRPKALKDRLMSYRGKKTEPQPKVAADRAKPEVDAQANNGTVINLMAIDSFKVSEISSYLHFLWASVPVQLTVALILLYKILGFSSFAGIALMALAAPINIFIARQFRNAQKKIMASTDARIHSTNEVLQNIRIIKYFAWEERFAQIVDEKRIQELKALRRRYLLWAAAATIWYSIPIVITFASFLLYTIVEKKDLVPSVAFPALSMFTLLRVPLDQLADMVARVQESKVSVDRVQKFLDEEETEKYDQLQDFKDSNNPPKIGLEHATLTWGSKDEDSRNDSFRLIDLNLSFELGQLNVIAGPTGSGKTSLLMALLGEMKLLEGSVHLPGGYNRETLRVDPETGLTEGIAYCAQQAWLVNDTIKENILFASPYDPARYKGVIQACALERDLEMLDAGDQTLVGEKGIALSGGQKQRISLARALYCNSRHILLDDCLSAVDSHTAKHIFGEGVMGPLMLNRTCILVTHNTSLTVPRSKFVVVLDNGKVTAQGKPEEVMASGALGDDFLKSKPGSVVASRALSRAASNLEDMTTNKANGTHAANGVNGTADPKKKQASSTQQENVNANTRTEGKATGSVQLSTIKMYLAAMGPWYYWVIAVTAFVGQQVSSVGTNIWIREWANSYHISRLAAADASTAKLLRHPSFASGSMYRTSLWSAPPSVSGIHKEEWVAKSSEVDVKWYLGMYVLIGLTFVFVSLFREIVLFWGSLHASTKIHRHLLDAVMRAKFRFFDSTPLGQIMNRFSKDIEAVDQEVAPVAIGLLHCLASVLTIVILISAITPGFLIAGFFIGLLYVGVGMFYIHSSRDLKRLESVQRSPLYQQFGETLSGVVTIRAYGDEERFIRDNHNRINTQSRPFIYLWATNRWLAFRIDIAGALVAFFAGVFVIRSVGTIDAGAAGLSMTYAITFTENILWVVRLYASNEQNMNAVERIKEYLEVDQEARASIPETKPPSNWPSHGAVEFIGYSTKYRDDLEPVLRNVTFTVRPAEKVGIVGRTGAGKSSLALALFRGLEATEGKVLIDGVDIGLIGLQDLREAITIVPQDPTLFTGTIRSNLDPFGIFTDEEIFTALRRVQLLSPKETISTLGVTTPTTPATPTTPTTPPNGTAPGASAIVNPVTASTARSGTEASETTLVPPPDDPSSSSPTLTRLKSNTRDANKNLFRNRTSPVAESGSNLSQGQRQLLCLARALLKSPRVLLMDEATASIDYGTDAKIQDTLREIKDNTIITIAHRLQTIIDYDKVLVLEAGKVVEFDDPWTLIKSEEGIFRGMCEQSGDLEGLMEAAKKAWEGRRLVDDT